MFICVVCYLHLFIIEPYFLCMCYKLYYIVFIWFMMPFFFKGIYIFFGGNGGEEMKITGNNVTTKHKEGKRSL